MRKLESADQGWHSSFIEGVDRNSYLSYSKTTKLLESERKFVFDYYLAKEKEVTASTKKGNLSHLAILQPELFRNKIIVEPKFSGTGMKARKQEWYDSLNGDEIVVTQKEQDDLFFMIDSVWSHRVARGLLENGKTEVIGYAYDESLDQWLLAQIDLLKDCGPTDLKTIMSTDRRTVETHLFTMGYYLQAYIYSRVFELITKTKCDDFPFIFVENKRPFTTEVYFCDQDTMTFGQYQLETANKVLKDLTSKIEMLQKENKEIGKQFWKGQSWSTDAQKIELPDWAKRKIENNPNPINYRG